MWNINIFCNLYFALLRTFCFLNLSLVHPGTVSPELLMVTGVWSVGTTWPSVAIDSKTITNTYLTLVAAGDMPDGLTYS